MDGAFIPDDAVVENDTVEIDTPPYYTETQIQTPNRAGFLTATSANGTISTDFLPAPKSRAFHIACTTSL